MIKKIWRKHKISIIVGAICLAVATGFVLFFSFSTSPLYDNFYGGFVHKNIAYGGDSAQFLTIGREWANGKVPYRDIFDHKGPVIFFIDALGYLMGGQYMICLIQIICLTATLFFLYKICGLASSRKLYAVFVMIPILVVLMCCYDDGNHVQEYCLPFIVASTYFICKFLSDKQSKKHDWKLALLYGITVGVCLLTQVTNAIPIGAGILAIIIVLAKQGNFKNLFQNLMVGLGGILLVCLPFAVYFMFNNAFGDFIFATFGFNAEYASSTGSWLKNATSTQLVTFLITYMGFLCIFPTILLAWLRRKHFYSIFLVVAALLEAFLFLSTQSYPHYAMITIAQIPLFINELLMVRDGDRVLSLVKISFVALLVIFGCKQVQIYGSSMPSKVQAIRNPQPVGYENIVQPYLDDMRATGVVTDGGNQLKDFFLKYNLPVQDKYFTIQAWHAKFDDKVSSEIETQFRTTSSKYVLLDKTQNFRDIIQERYELLGAEGIFELYRLK